MPEGSQNSGHAILDGLYELHDTVGTGGFAKVKVATHLQTGLKVRIYFCISNFDFLARRKYFSEVLLFVLVACDYSDVELDIK